MNVKQVTCPRCRKRCAGLWSTNNGVIEITSDGIHGVCSTCVSELVKEQLRNLKRKPKRL